MRENKTILNNIIMNPHSVYKIHLKQDPYYFSDLIKIKQLVIAQRREPI